MTFFDLLFRVVLMMMALGTYLMSAFMTYVISTSTTRRTDRAIPLLLLVWLFTATLTWAAVRR